MNSVNFRSLLWLIEHQAAARVLLNVDPIDLDQAVRFTLSQHNHNPFRARALAKLDQAPARRFAE